MLTKIAADEEAETWTPVAAVNVTAATGLGPVCVAFSPDGQRAYVSLFGPGIAVVDVSTMTVIQCGVNAGGSVIWPLISSSPPHAAISPVEFACNFQLSCLEP